jgi:hypothetical protein
MSVTVTPNVPAMPSLAVLASGKSASAWGATPLPLALDAFGMAGCTLRAAPDVLELGIGGPGGVRHGRADAVMQ